jgi:hypothetical protein
MDKRLLLAIKNSIYSLSQKIISNKKGNVYSFSEYKIRKRNGKEREITSPCKTFKQDNRQLLDLLILVTPPAIRQANSLSVADIYKKIESKIAKRNDLVSRYKKNYILKLDIKNAFSSTTKDLIIKNLITQCQLEYDVAESVAEACTLNSILPQGFATSRLLYEICAQKIDEYLKGLTFNTGYYRYIDDIILFGSFRIIPKHTLKQRIYTDIKNLTQFELNMDKYKLFCTTKHEIWFLSACIFHPNDKKHKRTKIRINKKIRSKQRSYLYAGVKKGNKESLAIAKALNPLVGCST